MPTLAEMLAAAKARKTPKENGTPLRVFLLLLSKGDPRQISYEAAMLATWLKPIVVPPGVKVRQLSIWEDTPSLWYIKIHTGIPVSIIYDVGKDIEWPKYPW